MWRNHYYAERIYWQNVTRYKIFLKVHMQWSVTLYESVDYGYNKYNEIWSSWYVVLSKNSKQTINIYKFRGIK